MNADSDLPKMTVATNLTDQHRDPSFISELMTQVLNGQTLQILETTEKWGWSRQMDGYEGWVYLPYLSEHVEQQPTHWVAAPSVNLLAEPNHEAAGRTVLLAGTAITIEEMRELWVFVRPAGNRLPGGWVPQAQLRPMRTLSAADARSQIIADARKLTGVYYLWGGASPFGLDCSGLAQLTHRLSGYTLPRDASMQFRATRPVDPPYQPGDLLFFHGDTNKDRITHVGISLGGWNIIHSSRGRNGVYEDDVQASENLRSTFVGGRILVER